MFSDAIRIVSKSIFPIFYKHTHKKVTRLGVSGTGFFIDNKGTFLTACHVINNVPGSELIYLGNVPFRIIGEPVIVQEVKRDNNKDIYIGKIEGDYYEPLKLATSGPPTGKSLCLCGYPLSRISRRPNGLIDVYQVRPYYQPSFVLDGFNGKINNINYTGFMTRDTSYPGMSGGPVFDINGVVWGMDVVSWSRPIPGQQDMKITNGVSIGSVVLSEFINENNDEESNK